jgi:hypothetical protein
METKLGWALAVAALLAGWQVYGWQGVLLAISVIVFWMLLQFSRALRVMRMAAESPVAMVPSVVMLHAGLKPGLAMLEVVKKTRSLGRKLEHAGEDVWRWEDASGAGLVLHFEHGKLQRWDLDRPGAAEAPPQTGP